MRFFMTPHLAWPSTIFETMSAWRFFQNMVLPQHCCMQWTKSAVSELGDLACVSVSPPSAIESVGFGVRLWSMVFDIYCRLLYDLIGKKGD